LLRAKWEAMKTALANQDITTALNYFSEEFQDLYNELFTVLYDQLPQIVQDMHASSL